MQVTIDTASREEAELIAAALPRPAEAKSVRGYGFIRLSSRNARETQEILQAAGAGAALHKLAWIRVRWNDEERVFRRGQPSF
jgi:hypothetical protein